MNRFINQANIKHFREMLKRSTEETQRHMLMRLLAEEEAKAEADDPLKKD
jgi:hypothetical protein